MLGFRRHGPQLRLLYDPGLDVPAGRASIAECPHTRTDHRTRPRDEDVPIRPRAESGHDLGHLTRCTQV